MKIKSAKFYVGVHLAGVVRTHFTGGEEWLKSAEVVPNMGLIVKTSRTDGNGEVSANSALVPFANIQYAILDESEPAQKSKAAKAV